MPPTCRALSDRPPPLGAGLGAGAQCGPPRQRNAPSAGRGWAVMGGRGGGCAAPCACAWAGAWHRPWWRPRCAPLPVWYTTRALYTPPPLTPSHTPRLVHDETTAPPPPRGPGAGAGAHRYKPVSIRGLGGGVLFQRARAYEGPRCWSWGCGLALAGEQTQSFARNLCFDTDLELFLKRHSARGVLQLRKTSFEALLALGAYRALCARCARAVRKVGCSPPPGVR